MDTEMKITKVTKELVPCLLKESIGETCCIFKAPRNLLQNNPLAFRPTIVSIGPYDNKNDESLRMIQQHKHRFLALFLEISNKHGEFVSTMSLENIVGELENDIRDSYSEPLQLSREDLVKMMVLDGCFVLILILVSLELLTLTNPNDTIFTIPWIVPTLRRDLLLLENQVPYTLLETLFGQMGFLPFVDLSRLVCKFFEPPLGCMSEKVLEKASKIQPRHILHLIRETLIPLSCYKTGAESSSSNAMHELILSAKRLQLQVIKFTTKRNADTVMDIGLEKNTLSIPPLILDQFKGTLFLNGVAFEQCFRMCEDDITSYVVFMGFLMKDKEDALFIINEKIIENCFGTHEEVYHLLKDVIKGVEFKLSESYLTPILRAVNTYTCRRQT